MKYYAARQREGGRWDYTVEQDLGISKVGYCVGPFESMWPDYTPEEFAKTPLARLMQFSLYQDWRTERLPLAHKYHADGHDTKDQACECFREFLLDHSVDYNLAGHGNGLRPCEALDCQNTTRRAVLYNNFYHFWLCDEHRTRDVVATMAPEVGEMYTA